MHLREGRVPCSICNAFIIMANRFRGVVHYRNTWVARELITDGVVRGTLVGFAALSGIGVASH